MSFLQKSWRDEPKPKCAPGSELSAGVLPYCELARIILTAHTEMNMIENLKWGLRCHLLLLWASKKNGIHELHLFLEELSVCDD